MKHNASWATLIQEKGDTVIVSIDCKRYVSGRKFWIAKITGTDKKYGFSREFVNGAYGAKILTAGVYDVCNIPRQGASDYERYFLRVYPTGEYRIIEREEVSSTIAGENNNPGEYAVSVDGKQHGFKTSIAFWED